MNDLAMRRNVTTRLEDAELVAERCLTRCDELLQAGKALSDRVHALENELGPVAQRLKMLEEHYIDFRKQHVTVLRRLLWVVRGG